MRYPSYFTFRVRPPCQSCWGGSDYVRPSRQHCWQQACPCSSLWDRFRSLRSARCGCRIIAVRPTCHGCWEAAMGPRLGSPLHDPYDGLDAESRPPGTVFGGAAPLTKPVKNQTAKWRKVPCDRMILFCSVGPASVRPSRGPCWQQPCSFLASGDHFWPCQAPAPTGAAAFSRTCKRATTLPTGVGAVRTCSRYSL